MIFILEDEHLVQECWRDQLSFRGLREGADFVFAEDFHAARTVWEMHRNEIDVVILDHRLAGTSTGLDVLNELSQDDRFPDILVVRCSSFKESGYPRSIPWFSKFEFRDCINYIWHRQQKQQSRVDHADEA